MVDQVTFVSHGTVRPVCHSRPVVVGDKESGGCVSDREDDFLLVFVPRSRQEDTPRWNQSQTTHRPSPRGYCRGGGRVGSRQNGVKFRHSKLG